MNKLADLDKLILEVLGEEAPPPKPEKGGFTGGEQAGSSTKHTGLALSDIVSILAVGTETDKVIKSSKSAYQALLKNMKVKFSSASSQEIVNFFKQFDFQAADIETQRCTSLGALVSKYAVASGLVWVFDQFNNQAGGYVNEAFMSELVGGQSVPVGGGGIEDILVNKSVGLNLKVKDTTAVHGSLTQLLETLNVPYVAVWDTDEEGGKGHYKVGWPGGEVKKYAALKLSPNATAIGIDKETKFAGGQQIKGQTVFVTPKSPITELYYLFFRKKGGSEDNPGMGLTLHVCRINKDSVKAEQYENGYAVLSTVNNPLGGIGGLIKSSPDYAMHEFTTKFDVKSMNEALEKDAGEVFESLKKLDAWYGALKGKVMDYVTSLEEPQLQALQLWLDEGEKWQFKALTKKCDN